MSAPESLFRLGPEPFSRDAEEHLQTRIGTIFLRTPGLVTLRGIHAMQRMAWIDELNRRRAVVGKPPLTDKEVEAELSESVDLLFDEHYALIRPDPNNMALAIRGDELLQTVVSKRRIRYLNIQNRLVRDALRRRGEAAAEHGVVVLSPGIESKTGIRGIRGGIISGIVGESTHHDGARRAILEQQRRIAADFEVVGHVGHGAVAPVGDESEIGGVGIVVDGGAGGEPRACGSGLAKELSLIHI